MKKILFRADAKPSIGTGDLMSLLHLSTYLEGFECYFLTQATQTAKGIIQRFQPKNIFWLEENSDVGADVAAINALIADKKIDIVFFEITERKLTDYVDIIPTVHKVCVNFDGHIPDNLRLLINWDAAAPNYYDLEKFPTTKFLLGPRYVILPKSFYSEIIQYRKYSDTRRNLLIAMGGADELDFTSKVAEILAEGIYTLTIIVGAGYSHKDALTRMLDTKPCRYTIKTNVQDMLSEYLACDFAIGAGGLTSSELVASRTPCALIATYEHQIARCNYFHQHKWVEFLGYRLFKTEALLSSIETFLPQFGTTVFDTTAIIDELKKV
jgi:spore coat polysaccharide biosynthesis predicted glycosyltransferase SpsG